MGCKRNKQLDDYYSLASNERVCSCGLHKGKGQATAHEQAQIYNWYRQKMPVHYMREQREYLESYEATHGALGKNEFIYNSSRWKDNEKVKSVLDGGNLDF